MGVAETLAGTIVAVVVGLIGLVVLALVVLAPLRRFESALGGLRTSLEVGIAPLRAGLRRRAR